MTTDAEKISERNFSHLENGQQNHRVVNSRSQLAAENQCGADSFSVQHQEPIDQDPSCGTWSWCANDNDRQRKPSYVGLSSLVSGYSPFTRYQSPSRKTSPTAIPVSSPPQVLDCKDIIMRQQQQELTDITTPPVRGQLDEATHYFPSHTRKIFHSDTTVETVTRFYANRDQSPASDGCQPVGGSAGTNGNLVQKQIERLYGGRIQSIRLTSPEPRSPDSTDDANGGLSPGAFVSRRWRPDDLNSTPTSSLRIRDDGDPLELKSLKVPAVFRLLRPEFREQLKMNSCQVRIPTDSSIGDKKERVIPIIRETDTKTSSNSSSSSSSERVIPIRIEQPGSLALLHDSTHDDCSRSTSIPIEKVSESGTQASGLTKLTPTVPSPRASVAAITKPALPAKPVSPKRPTKTPTTPPPAGAVKPMNGGPAKGDDIPVAAPAAAIDKSLVEENQNKESPSKWKLLGEQDLLQSEQRDEFDQLLQPLTSRYAHHHDQDEDDEDEDYHMYSADRFARSSTSPSCGLMERSQLCPILEEDAESTASGCSTSASLRTPQLVSAVMNSSSYPAKTRTRQSDQGPFGDAAELQQLDEDQDSSVVILEGEEFLTKSEESQHDGHYFIRLLENEVFKFEEQICDFEEDLANDSCCIPEDVRDSILAAIGKAKLLISQKFVQFRGLCDKNTSENAHLDPFVPTSQDLAGFWDMVYIQVEHIHSLFQDLSRLRSNGWKEEQVVNPPKKVAPRTSKKMQKNGVASGSKNSTAKPAAAKSEAAKARDEARKKMMEEKKRLMKLKAEKSEEDQVVQMFLPES